jgi:hypothetical protein
LLFLLIITRTSSTFSKTAFKERIQLIFSLLPFCSLDFGLSRSEKGIVETFNKDRVCGITTEVFPLFFDL